LRLEHVTFEHGDLQHKAGWWYIIGAVGEGTQQCTAKIGLWGCSRTVGQTCKVMYLEKTCKVMGNSFSFFSFFSNGKCSFSHGSIYM
jgi:hypothetical protein